MTREMEIRRAKTTRKMITSTGSSLLLWEEESSPTTRNGSDSFRTRLTSNFSMSLELWNSFGLVTGIHEVSIVKYFANLVLCEARCCFLCENFTTEDKMLSGVSWLRCCCSNTTQLWRKHLGCWPCHNAFKYVSCFSRKWSYWRRRRNKLFLSCVLSTLALFIAFEEAHFSRTWALGL